MIPHSTIQKNLNNCLADTEFLGIPGIKKGKVRDSYVVGNEIILITTDRQSAFDRILANVPYKGQVLNQVSAFWFENTLDIVPNHVLAIPDPAVTVAKKCQVFPIEFVMRGYLTGSTDTSAWTMYSKGLRDICGNILPDGMIKNQKFPVPILTPTTKSDEHDRPISAEEILREGIIEASTWHKLEAIAKKLFARGTEIAAKHGLILVDTKYELGLDESGQITLVDEIHTPDSSRYWLSDTYDACMTAKKEPQNIDKEFLRLWFKDHCDPYNDKVLPAAPEELIVELSSRYIKLYEMITGKEFLVDTTESVKERISRNLAHYK